MILKNFIPIPNDSENAFWRFLSRFDILGLFERDPFGNWMILKRLVIFFAGVPTHWRMAIANQMKIEGTEHIANLPHKNVFFISNHQTYFADVIAFYQIFCAVKFGLKNYMPIPVPFHLFAPRSRVFYVAAKETMMKAGIIPKIFSLAGAILVERSWRAEGQNVQRNLDSSAGDNVAKALQYGWVVSFPQGTTSPYATIRRGTAHIIKETNPIVVPVVINGFRRAFDKKGLQLKKRNTHLSIKFKEPIYFEPDMDVDAITEKVTNIIEQNIPDLIAEWKKQANSSE